MAAEQGSSRTSDLISISQFDIWIAILVAVGISCLICVIDVPNRSRANLRACLGRAFIVYTLILIIGNIVTTILATSLIAGKFPTQLSNWLPLVYAITGAFAFQGVLSNMNMTLFKKGILTIDDWITRARDDAVATATEKQAALNQDFVQEAVIFLMNNLSEQELNAHIGRHVGPNAVHELEVDARKAETNPAFYKAYAFAQDKPKEAAAIMKSLKRYKKHV